MKKIYESPSVEKNSLLAEENLMAEPSISGGGYGWADGGPEAVKPVE